MFGIINGIVWGSILFIALIMFDIGGSQEKARAFIAWQGEVVDTLEVYGNKISEAKEEVTEPAKN